jgi:hypothetical protein
VRVHCHDRHAEVADYSPGDHALKTYRRANAPHRDAPLRGHYSTLNHRLAVLYREDDVLKLYLEGAGVTVLGEGVTAAWQLVTRNKARLSLSTPAIPDAPIEVVYRSDYNQITSLIATTPNASREDWDFGLFVSNVLKDDERREKLYRDDA